MKADGSGAAVIQEGDFENLALAGSTPASSSTTSKSTTTSRTTTGATTTTTTATTTGTTTTKAPPKATGSVSEITIAITGTHYRVAWIGTTSARWKVTLKVGRKSTSAIVAKTARSHTFTVKATGAVTASVTPTN